MIRSTPKGSMATKALNLMGNTAQVRICGLSLVADLSIAVQLKPTRPHSIHDGGIVNDLNGYASCFCSQLYVSVRCGSASQQTSSMRACILKVTSWADALPALSEGIEMQGCSASQKEKGLRTQRDLPRPEKPHLPCPHRPRFGQPPAQYPIQAQSGIAHICRHTAYVYSSTCHCEHAKLFIYCSMRTCTHRFYQLPVGNGDLTSIKLFLCRQLKSHERSVTCVICIQGTRSVCAPALLYRLGAGMCSSPEIL